MEYNIEQVDNVLKVALDGRLTAACSEEFKETFSAKLSECKNILFDLSNMSHIDSSGLGVLVSLFKKATNMGGTVKLACLQPRPKIVFDITKVYRVFEIFDNVEAGLESFKKS